MALGGGQLNSDEKQVVQDLQQFLVNSKLPVIVNRDHICHVLKLDTNHVFRTHRMKPAFITQLRSLFQKHEGNLDEKLFTHICNQHKGKVQNGGRIQAHIVQAVEKENGECWIKFLSKTDYNELQLGCASECTCQNTDLFFKYLYDLPETSGVTIGEDGMHETASVVNTSEEQLCDSNTTSSTSEGEVHQDLFTSVHHDDAEFGDDSAASVSHDDVEIVDGSAASVSHDGVEMSGSSTTPSNVDANDIGYDTPCSEFREEHDGTESDSDREGESESSSDESESGTDESTQPVHEPRVTSKRKINTKPQMFLDDSALFTAFVNKISLIRPDEFDCRGGKSTDPCGHKLTLKLCSSNGMGKIFAFRCTDCKMVAKHLPTYRNYGKPIHQDAETVQPTQKKSALVQLNKRVSVAALLTGVSVRMSRDNLAEMGVKPMSENTIRKYWDEAGKHIVELGRWSGVQSRAKVHRLQQKLGLNRNLEVTYFLDAQGEPLRHSEYAHLEPTALPPGVTRHTGRLYCVKISVDGAGFKRAYAHYITGTGAAFVVLVGVPGEGPGDKWQTEVSDVYYSSIYCSRCSIAMKKDGFDPKNPHEGPCGRNSKHTPGQSETELAKQMVWDLVNPKRLASNEDVAFIPTEVSLDGDATTFESIEHACQKALEHFYGVTPLDTKDIKMSYLPDAGHLIKNLSGALRKIGRTLSLSHVKKYSSYVQSNIQHARKLVSKICSDLRDQNKNFDFQGLCNTEEYKGVVNILHGQIMNGVQHLQGIHDWCLPDTCDVAEYALEASKADDWATFCELSDEELKEYFVQGSIKSLEAYKGRCVGSVASQRNTELATAVESSSGATSTSGDSNTVSLAPASSSVASPTLANVNEADARRANALSAKDVEAFLRIVGKRLDGEILLHVLAGLDTQRAESFFSMLVVYSHGKRLFYDQIARSLDFMRLCQMKMNVGWTQTIELVLNRLGIVSNSVTIEARQMNARAKAIRDAIKQSEPYRRQRCQRGLSIAQLVTLVVKLAGDNYYGAIKRQNKKRKRTYEEAVGNSVDVDLAPTLFEICTKCDSKGNCSPGCGLVRGKPRHTNPVVQQHKSRRGRRKKKTEAEILASDFQTKFKSTKGK